MMSVMSVTGNTMSVDHPVYHHAPHLLHEGADDPGRNYDMAFENRRAGFGSMSPSKAQS